MNSQQTNNNGINNRNRNSTQTVYQQSLLNMCDVLLKIKSNLA